MIEAILTTVKLNEAVSGNNEFKIVKSVDF